MIKIKSRGKLRIIVSVFLILCAIILLGFISPLRIKKYNLTFDNLPEGFGGNIHRFV